MADDFKHALSKSMQDFKIYVEPRLIEILNGGYFSVVEGNTLDETARMLDTLAGIDLWYYRKGNAMWGVASRIQRGHNYMTFTIRKSRESGVRTEYEKRLDSMRKKSLYPHLTVQAYIDNDKLTGMGVARTEDIFEYIQNNHCLERSTGGAQKGQASFIVVPWVDMECSGYRVIKWHERKEKAA